MNRKRRFSASNNYLGLEEALNSIEVDSDDGLEYDLAIIPPDHSVVTDEEEGFDDDIITSSTLPRDVPGNVEVFVRNFGSLSDSGDSSDDKPLSAKRTRTNTLMETEKAEESYPAPTRTVPMTPVWRKCKPIYSKVYKESGHRLKCENRVKEELKDLTPVQIFEKLFDDDVFEMTVYNSNLYANQNNRHNFCVTIEELKVFFGILILSGYHKLPRESMCWSLDEDIGVDVVSKAMSRNRFREIKRNLHLVNNNDFSNTTDKMFKLRKNSINGKFFMKIFLLMNPWSSIMVIIRQNYLFEVSLYVLGSKIGLSLVHLAIAIVLIYIVEKQLLPLLRH
ncbi:unnamed protein product [Euphydryas editha]|uniref:PiggyBac transposable element-derived protein domain-containing protein n=1 Tax=Euphydryas editha TaxID=104508 RepID=A0AAU9TD97_EUPED|nr:unnamed protein product [Euphydryas editha]